MTAGRQKAFSENDGRPKKYSETDIHDMGKKLIECAKRDGVYHVTHFCEDFEKCPTWVYEIARDYPKFGEYLARARCILGNKMLSKAIDANPSMMVQKMFMKRYISNEYENAEKWHKEDIELEATAKAEAIKSANLAEVSQVALDLIEKLDGLEKDKKPNQAANIAEVSHVAIDLMDKIDAIKLDKKPKE